MSERFLDPNRVRAFYDWLGSGQDWQRFYEGPAIRQLLKAAEFDRSHFVFEFGCGTGAFAQTLLQAHLSENAKYLGVDISPVMVTLARTRLRAFGERAQVLLTEGELDLPLAGSSVDRFVANYVLDLLPPEAIRQLLDEAWRVLAPQGRLCLVSLTPGRGIGGRAVTSAWRALHRLNPLLVGGCRPLELREFVRPPRWELACLSMVSAFGMASEVVVAAKTSTK